MTKSRGCCFLWLGSCSQCCEPYGGCTPDLLPCSKDSQCCGDSVCVRTTAGPRTIYFCAHEKYRGRRLL